MTTTSVQTSELTGAALRYAVAVAAGYEVKGLGPSWPGIYRVGGSWFVDTHNQAPEASFEPDRNWSQLGPLKQHCRVDTEYLEGYVACCIYTADPHTVEVIAEQEGPDELIAACRAIAASYWYWGEYADIPTELVERSEQ